MVFHRIAGVLLILVVLASIGLVGICVPWRRTLTKALGRARSIILYSCTPLAVVVFLMGWVVVNRSVSYQIESVNAAGIASSDEASALGRTLLPSGYTLEQTADGGWRWRAADSRQQRLADAVFRRFATFKAAEERRAQDELEQLLKGPPASDFASRARRINALFAVIQLEPVVSNNETLIETTRKELERLAALAKQQEEARQRAEQARLKAEREAEEARLKAEREAAERTRNEEAAMLATSHIWHQLYPGGVFNWMTCERGYNKKGQYVISFEYSVKNVFGARVQRRFTTYSKNGELVDYNDEYLYIRSD